jgi:hypothetical protein
MIVMCRGVSSAYPDISGKLNLVDLAGSERVKKSLVVRDRLAEACAINKYVPWLQTLSMPCC